jgi:uncharacterized protein (TIGR02453 family)
MMSIQPSTLGFLKNLAKNNNRAWFAEHKNQYLAAQSNMITFIDDLILAMNKHDELETESGKKSLFRIYNDVRFSKDKSPYNPRFAFSLKRATKLKRGGYYMNIKPGNCFLACGFFAPNADDLKRIRQDIDYNYPEWNSILQLKSIKSTFGALQGDTVVTAPRGYITDHEAIALLRHKQFIVRHHFTDAEVVSPDFLKQVNMMYKNVRPFFDYMSSVLTTDSNGELIV